MGTDLYIQLIYKHLKGEISTSEQDQLDIWLKENSQHQVTFHSIEKQWIQSEQYEPGIEIDVKADFEKLTKRIEKQAPTKVVAIKSRRKFLIGMAASFLVLVAGYWMFFTQQAPEMIHFQTASNETKKLELPDGSKVWLNENSQLTYPKAFVDSKRDVTLKGEAFFEVEKNPKAPFSIEIGKTKVTVLGTSFNIKNRDDKTVVSVNTGKVAFFSKETKQSVQLVKGESGIFNKRSKKLQKVQIGAADFTWHSGILKFNNSPILEVIHILEKQFNISINLSSNMNKCTFSGMFKDKTIVEILDYMKDIYKFKVEKRSKSEFSLKDGQCQ